MFFKLALLFTVVPIAELYLLIRTGRVIGADVTILIVLVTGIAGAALAKKQGFKVLGDIRGCMERGEIPGKELLEGILVLAGGVTLLTPGFVTDAVGFTLLIPFTRKLYAGLILKYFSGRFTTTVSTPGETHSSYIDVEKIEDEK